MNSPDEVKQTIRDQGWAARELLAAPAYSLILNALSDFHLTAMVETAQGSVGQPAREKHHTQLHALRALHEEVQHLDQALKDLEADEEREEAEQEEPE